MKLELRRKNCVEGNIDFIFSRFIELSQFPVSDCIDDFTYDELGAEELSDSFENFEGSGFEGFDFGFDKVGVRKEAFAGFAFFKAVGFDVLDDVVESVQD